MTFIVFFIILAVLVLTHELGHFLAAKKAGAKVLEFGFGFPPRLWSFKYGETEYSINWIPFGGFVKILGEDGNPACAIIDGQIPSGSLASKNRFVQAGVLAAGVIFNILLAWFILSLGLSFGMPTTRDGVPDGYTLDKQQLIISEVLPNSPAAEAKLQAGEIIVYLADWKEKITNPSVTEVQQFVAAHGDQSMTIGYLSLPTETEAKEVKIIPRSEVIGSTPALGISMTEVGILKLPWYVAIWEGLKLTGLVIWSIILALIGLVAGIFRGQTEVLSSVTGPIGLISVVGSSLSLGWSYLLNLTAVISLNLAVINFMPFPALDGGRILFLAIEAITRRPINQKIAEGLNAAGFFILISLMLVLTLRDIVHLF